ncbi:MAG TPA: hypothetical protein VNB94_11870 [Mycobacteriales bacterium]|nr:hypothetical protein [Mycobacteriales bacterium]
MTAHAIVVKLHQATSRIGTTPVDAALALAATALVATELDYTGVHPVLGYGVALTTLLSLAWRRRNPVVVATVVCATNLMLSLASTNPYGPKTSSPQCTP